jgi:hypothetical protein
MSKLSQAERRRMREEEFHQIRDELIHRLRRCEVPGCEETDFQIHHMKNQGLAMRDHRVENLMGLCIRHHILIDSMGKETWAKTFFWGATYEQVCEHVAMNRRLEEAGVPPEIVPIPVDERAGQIDIKGFMEQAEKDALKIRFPSMKEGRRAK